jgi:hypothetical protein
VHQGEYTSLGHFEEGFDRPLENEIVINGDVDVAGISWDKDIKVTILGSLAFNDPEHGPGWLIKSGEGE